MKDIIYYSIIGGLFLWNTAYLFKQRKKDNLTYHIVYLKRHKDWFLALFTIICLLTVVIAIEPHLPKFLKWGLFSLLDKQGTNANVEIIQQSAKISPILVIVIFSILMLLLPKTSYWEEIQFRYGRKTYQQSIFSNIRFGLMHCIVGVPIYIGLLLIGIGFVYSVKYIREYKKTSDHDIALEASASLHGKYNAILVIFLAVALLFLI